MENRKKRGQVIIEYILLLSIVTLSSLALLGSLTKVIQTKFKQIEEKLSKYQLSSHE